MAKVRRKNVYALYLNDEIISMGTVAEIANELGIHQDTVRFYGYPCYAKRRAKAKDRRYLVQIGKTDDDDHI